VRGPIRRPRRAQYGAEEADALAFLAELFDDICSKRLRAAIDVELPRLYQAGVLRISSTCYENLLQVSPATMDRLRSDIDLGKGSDAASPNPALCSSSAFRSAPGPTGPKIARGFVRSTWLTTVAAWSRAGASTPGPSASPMSRPAGQSVSPSETKPKSTSSLPFSAPVNVCLSRC